MSDVSLLLTVLDLLSAPSLSLRFLSVLLSLKIAYEVFLQNTNVLQSPWKQWEQRSRQGRVRRFCVILPPLPNALVINACLYVRHMHGTHLTVGFFPYTRFASTACCRAGQGGRKWLLLLLLLLTVARLHSSVLGSNHRFCIRPHSC